MGSWNNAISSLSSSADFLVSFFSSRYSQMISIGMLNSQNTFEDKSHWRVTMSHSFLRYPSILSNWVSKGRQNVRSFKVNWTVIKKERIPELNGVQYIRNAVHYLLVVKKKQGSRAVSVKVNRFLLSLVPAETQLRNLT